MKQSVVFIPIAILAIYIGSCRDSSFGNKEAAVNPSSADTDLAVFISKIKSVDNHAHPNTIDADDKGSDALPLDGLGNIELPSRMRPQSSVWLDAARALYGYKGSELDENAMKDLADSAQRRAHADDDLGIAGALVAHLPRRNSDVRQAAHAAGTAEVAEVCGLKSVTPDH